MLLTKKYCFVILFIALLLPTQAAVAGKKANAEQLLYDSAQRCLERGDSLKALQVYESLNVRIDSIAKADYGKEVKALRSTYQIDELLLKNELQRNRWMKLLSFGLFGFLLLLGAAVYYLRVNNRKLRQARLKSKQLEREAEFSEKEKTKLLYALSTEMTSLLAQIEVTVVYLLDNPPESPFNKTQIAELRSAVNELQKKTLIFSTNETILTDRCSASDGNARLGSSC
ncbi:MAG: hypothetical protein RR365_12710 [Bacteroides sp.]